MRFARLHLEKYGHFEACELAFPRGAQDFHLVLGANEAGKSTTMAAVNDLLFGFPHITPYDFRFAATLLRVGAVLEDATGPLAVRRRKGRAETLRDAQDAPMEEAPLHAMLRGLSGDQFRLSSSLDHRRLREGGRAIVAAKDDIGQALFAAGSGLVQVQSVLRDLQTEADGVWGPKSKGRSFWQAEAEFAAASARLKAATLKPKAWSDARDRVDRLTAEQAALEAARATHQAALKVLQRARRLAAPAQARAELMRQLADLPPSSLDAEHGRIFADAKRRLDDATLKARIATDACADLQDRRGRLVPDQRLLDRQEAINDLVSAGGAARKEMQDLPDRQEDLAVLVANVRRLAVELALPPVAWHDLPDRLPSRLALDALHSLANERRDMETRLASLGDHLARGEQNLAQAEADLAAAPVPPSLDSGDAAVQDGQAALTVDAGLPKRRRAADRAAETLAAALARLRPWPGDAAALAAMVPPPEDDISAAETAAQDARHSVETQARSLILAVQSLARVEEQLRQTLAGRGAVSFEELAEARSRRQTSWAPLRQALAGGAALPRPEPELATYDALVAEADASADTRFETAEASAKLAQLTGQRALARLEKQQAEQRHQVATAAQDAASQAWHALLAAAGLPPMTPAAARQWRAGQADALQRVADRADADFALGEDLARVDAARAALLAMLSQDQAARLGQTPSLAGVLDGVRRLQEMRAADARHHAVLRTRVADSEAAIRDDRQRLAVLTQAIADWSSRWARSCQDAGMAGAAAWTDLASRAQLIEELRGVLEQAAGMQRRIADITRNQLAFQTRVLTLAADCGVTDPALSEQALTEALRLRLRDTLADARQAADLDAALLARSAEQREAELTVAAAQAQIAPLMALAGVSEQQALAQALDAATAARAARADLASIEQKMLTDGDGYPLAALIDAATGVDPAALAAEERRLEALVTTLDDEIAAKAREAGEAQQAFTALDHGADAALAAADMEQARAAMAAEAEAYLLKRTQAVMLKRAIDTYRERRQHPMLLRAGALFSTLTLGRYRALQVDPDSDPARLVAVSADGASTVTVEALSDGTADQLFLALRLAALEQSLQAGIVLPFLADDLFINFDDRRAHAGFRVLGDLARQTQVLFFTHHEHLRDIAQDALGAGIVSICRLGLAA